VTRPPFTRILLATEHTEFDVGAETVAIELARRWEQPLSAVLPIVTNPEYEVEAPGHARAAEQAVASAAEALRTLTRTAEVAFEIAIRRGDERHRLIVEEARATRADLVVLRRRGRASFLARMMVGEMVGNVIREAPCGVLLVPRACRVWSAKVLAAVDGTSIAAGVVATAARLAASAGVPLVIASVAANDSAEARAAATAAIEGALRTAHLPGPGPRTRVASGPAAERVVGLAADEGADLIVVGRGTAHSALRRMVFGSTAHRIVGLANCPVLVVPG